MEKMRPIEEKLSYKISKIIDEVEESEKINGKNKTLRPHPEQLEASDDENKENDLSKADEEDEEERDEVYKPRKLIAVEYTYDKLTESQKAEKELERQKKRLRKSEVVQALRSEFSEAPEEIGGKNDDDLRISAILRRQKEREEYEEENLLRLPVTNKEKKDISELKILQKRRLKGGSTIDELTAFAETIVEDDDLSVSKKTQNSLGSYLNAAAQAQKATDREKAAKKTVDQIITARPAPTIRKERKDKNDDNSMEEDDENESFSEDEDLNELLEEKQQRKQEKAKQAILKTSSRLPEDQVVVKGKRAITRKIEENKGLVRKRKAIEGNARAHYRLKYQKKIKKLQGNQRPMNKPKPQHYEGEGSGIRSRVKKSVTLK